MQDGIYCTQLHIQAHISQDMYKNTKYFNKLFSALYIYLYCKQQKLNKYYYGNIPAYMTIKKRIFHIQFYSHKSKNDMFTLYNEIVVEFFYLLDFNPSDRITNCQE